MNRGRLRYLGLLFLILALVPASLVAQASQDENNNDESFIFQVNRPVSIAADDTVDAVVVINDNAVIEGDVDDALVVVRGTATVNGNVSGDIFVVEGTLNLSESATVDNVTLVRSDLNRADGATITGDLEENANYSELGWGAAIFSIVFWIGLTIAILLASLLVMALFGRQIRQAAETITARPLETGVTGLATWVILPIVAILAFVTIIGIPVGLGILLVVMPLLGLMGYIVASYWLGAKLGSMMNLRVGPYALLIIGLVLLQLVGLIPWFGGLLAFIATLMGTGALVYYLWRARREPSAMTVPAGTLGGSARA
jgi:hypothetical protein